MLTVSPVYNDFLQRRDRTWLLNVEIDGVDYDSTRIVDLYIEHDIAPSADFTLGIAPASRCVLTIRSLDTIPPNARVVPYLAMSLESMTWDTADYAWDEADFAWDGSISTERLPLGVFYVDNRKRVNNMLVLECYDGMVYADIKYVSQLDYPATMQQVWDEVCAQAGLIYDSSVQINPEITINAGPADYTCRQVLGYIAGLHGASVKMSRSGEISWRVYRAAEMPVATLTEADYMQVRQLNPVRTYTRLVVIYDEDDQLSYEAGEGGEHQTLYLINPFATQEIVDTLYEQLNGFSYIPIDMDCRGYPQMEHGDRIAYEVSESIAWEDADISWDEADFAWDGVETYQTLILRQTFAIRGGVGMWIEAPSLSEQESEFQIDGTLTAAIKRLNQSAVRKDKAYYGLSVSDKYGLKVQRTDGKSELTLNSDVMDWKVDGVSSLYYDALDNVIKFTGHLEAASGTFTGSLQGGSITIGSGNNVFRADNSGIWAGHSNWVDAPFYVNMQGQLTAVNANVSGTITAISGRIGGWQIKDNVLTSSLSSYPRVELNPDSNEMTFYANPLSFVRIGSINLSSSWNQPYLLLQNGQDYVELENGPLYATISGNRQIRFNFPQIYLDDIVYVNFNDLRDEMTGDSIGLVLLELENEVNKKLDASDGLTTFVDVFDGVNTSRLFFTDGQLVGII